MKKDDAPAVGDAIRPREHTYQLIVLALKNNPAYILLFGIGLLGGAMGVGTTAVGFFRENTTLMILGFSTWVLLLAASLMVIRFMERKPQAGAAHAILDQVANRAFTGGPSAESLTGKWKVKWYVGEGEQRRPYGPDPKDEIGISTSGSVLFCSAYDPSTKKTYWMFGRYCDGGVVCLMYWSQSEVGLSLLNGVVLLQSDADFKTRGKKLVGWWKGLTRDGNFTTGETEWTKSG